MKEIIYPVLFSQIKGEFGALKSMVEQTDKITGDSGPNFSAHHASIITNKKYCASLRKSTNIYTI